MTKNVKLVELHMKYATVSLNTQTLKWFNRIQMFVLQQKYQQKFDEKLKGRFFNTYKFSNHGNNKFILLLRKGVYPYQ